MTPPNHSRGFTLIELSIVLVIIGLIVGGVLVGRDLIAAAKLRYDISTIEKLNTAVNTFRAKYSCLPGDCKNASSFFSSAPDGNGDGIINGMQAPGGFIGWRAVGTDGVMEENSAFYIHLANANLIPLAPFTTAINVANIGPGVTWLGFKSTSFVAGSGTSTGVVATAYNGVNYWGLAAVTQWPGGSNIFNAGGWSPVTAFALDSKIDDGFPFTGALQDALHPSYLNATTYVHYAGCVPQTAGAGYNNNGWWDNLYNVQNTSNVILGGVPIVMGPCAPMMKAQW